MFLSYKCVLWHCISASFGIWLLYNIKKRCGIWSREKNESKVMFYSEQKKQNMWHGGNKLAIKEKKEKKETGWQRVSGWDSQPQCGFWTGLCLFATCCLHTEQIIGFSQQQLEASFLLLNWFVVDDCNGSVLKVALYAVESQPNTQICWPWPLISTYVW